jgi:hypothetical protein
VEGRYLGAEAAQEKAVDAVCGDDVRGGRKVAQRDLRGLAGCARSRQAHRQNAGANLAVYFGAMVGRKAWQDLHRGGDDPQNVGDAVGDEGRTETDRCLRTAGHVYATAASRC